MCYYREKNLIAAVWISRALSFWHSNQLWLLCEAGILSDCGTQSLFASLLKSHVALINLHGFI